MKKHFKIFMILFVAALSVIGFSRHASADEDLVITDWVVDASLMENGDLRISEDITFEFDDKFNGIFRDIVLDNTSGISDITVAMVDGKNSSDFSLVSKAKNGDKGVYTLEEKNSRLVIKVFSPSKDETKTFRFNYIVNNVAVKYNDTGELYYKFLGRENETSIKRFTVNIRLPYKDNSDKVKIYAHGPLNGTIEKLNNDLYQLKVKNVPTKTFIEGRLLFPTEYIAASTNVKKLDRYQQVIDEEAAFLTKLEQNRQRKEATRSLLNKITLVFSAISVLALALVLYQCRRTINKDFLKIEYRDIPEDCTPAVASYISGLFIGSNVIFATILDLFRKGYLKISGENDAFDASENSNYVIQKTRDGDTSLVDHERYFMDWLFNDIGKGNAVSTDDIKNYTEHNQAKYIYSHGSWKKKVKAEADKLGYFDHSKTVQGSILIILSIIHIILGIVTAISASLYALLSFGLGVVCLIYGITLFYRLSDKGYLQHKKWVSFRKYIKKQRPDLSKEEAFDSLDPTLIYALGLNVISKQRLTYARSGEYAMNSWVFWYIIFASEDNTFRKSIDSSFAGSTSSSSVGGFSGGGGGGAGGGGAGGF